MGATSIWHWVILIIIIYTLFFDWRWIYDWYPIGRFVKKSHFRRWRVKEFCSRFISDGKIQKKAARLEPEQLAWASILTDHRSIAKKVIAEEFTRRGIPAAAVAGWLPQAIHISSSRNTHTTASPKVYQKLVRDRRFWLRVARTLAMVAVPFIPVLFLTSLADRQNATIPPLLALGYLVGAGTIVGILTIAFCVATFGRGRDLRILLLRPFGNKDLSGPLKRLVPREIGPWGTVYTLSDKSYYPSIFLRIGERFADLGYYALGILLRPSRRLAIVRNERTFLNLARMLSRTKRPSFKTFLAGDQALNIKTTDGCWQLVVDMLLHSTEVAVMDLSQIGKGSAWEVGQMRRRGLLSKCVFIAQEEYATAAPAALFQAIGEPVSARIHLYSRNGLFVDVDAFRRDLLNAAVIELEKQK